MTEFPVTPHELDAWLRFTDVRAEPAAAARKKRRGRGTRRRSSLDYVDPVQECFGIDAPTLLGTASENRRESDWRLVSNESLDFKRETDWRLMSNESLDHNPGKENSRETDWRLVSNESLDYHQGKEDVDERSSRGARSRRSLPAIPFEARGRASSLISESDRTCDASCDTVPQSNGRAAALVSPTEEDERLQENCGPLRDANTVGRCPVSPTPPVDPTSAPTRPAAGSRRVSATEDALQDPYRLLRAMDESRDSHDCLHRWFDESTSRGAAVAMRESERSRRALLLALRGIKVGGAATDCLPRRRLRRSSAPEVGRKAKRRIHPASRDRPDVTVKKARAGNGWRPSLRRVGESRPGGLYPPKPVHYPGRRSAEGRYRLNNIRAELRRIAMEQMVEEMGPAFF